MPKGEFETLLRDKKDHYAITLYKDLRDKLKISSNSLLLLKINGEEFVKKPTKQDFHITIPKIIIDNPNGKVKIRILNNFDINQAIKRKKQTFNHNLINISSVIPNKTLFNNQIYVCDSSNYLYVWYPTGGGAKHIKIKKRFDVERLSELLGFYFGDGNTSESIRAFRLNNCEASVLNYCLDILEDLGVKRSEFKVQIIYSTPESIINEDIKRRCILYWSHILNINQNKIVSVNRNKAKSESLKYGSARLFFDNATFVEVILHGLLKKFLNIIQNPTTPRDYRITKGFLRGIAAAEGSVTLNRFKSLTCISLSFDPHSEELSLYYKILNNLKIIPSQVHKNELTIHNISNFKIMNKMDLFKLHKSKKEKFFSGYKNHKFS